MDDIKIALDLEGVLVNVHSFTIEHSDYFEEDDFDTFGFDGDRLGRLLDEFERFWENHTLELLPTEPDQDELVRDLRTCGTVDIVTNTPGAREDVETWLDHHGIEYNELVMPGPRTHKEELGYDVYIDDNPFMIGRVNLQYLFDGQPNNHYNGDRLPNHVDDPAKIVYYDLTIDEPMVLNSIHDGRSTLVRVDSLAQVYADLTHRQVEGATAI